MIDFQNARVRRLVIAGGIALSGLAGFGYAGFEAHGKAGELDAEAEQIRSQIQTAQREIALIPRLEEQVLRLRAQVQDQVRILPDDAEIHEFVEKLSKFASEAGVTIEKLDDTAAQRRGKSRGASKEAFDRITYKLQLVAGANELLAFFDRFENEYDRFVRITTFRVRADSDFTGRIAEDPDARARHDVTMELETYVYNPKTRGVDQVQIPDEQRKLGALIAAGKLETGGAELTIERYDLVDDVTRVDPFVDPRVQASRDAENTERRREVEELELEGLLATLTEVRGLLGKEDGIDNKVRLLQAQESTDVALRGLAERISKLDDEEYFLIEETRGRFVSEVVNPVKGLMSDRGAVVLDPRQRVVNELKALEQRVRRAAERNDFALVVSIAAEAEGLSALGQGSRDVERVLASIIQLRKEAEVVTEFGEIALEFGGSIVLGGENPRAVVILNGRSFTIGEEVQPDLKLIGIERDALTFQFRGFEVVRELRDQ